MLTAITKPRIKCLLKVNHSLSYVLQLLRAERNAGHGIKGLRENLERVSYWVIKLQEMARDEVNEIKLEEYETKFLEEPHLEIKLRKMNISFNPQNLIPLDAGEGTIYPTVRISDEWGILTVTSGGALLGPSMRWVIVSEPLQITEKEISGDGWILELNEGYSLEQTHEGNYLMTKKK